MGRQNGARPGTGPSKRPDLALPPPPIIGAQRPVQPITALTVSAVAHTDGLFEGGPPALVFDGALGDALLPRLVLPFDEEQLRSLCDGLLAAGLEALAMRATAEAEAEGLVDDLVELATLERATCKGCATLIFGALVERGYCLTCAAEQPDFVEQFRSDVDGAGDGL